MVSSNVWIAGVVVPPVTLLVGVVWSIWWYRRAKRLLGHGEGLPQTVQVNPHLVPTAYQGWSHGIDLVTSPLATPLPSPFPRLPSAPSPSPSPPPSPPASSIHTSINRKGSRVLSKRKRPSSTGPPSRRVSSSGTLADYPLPEPTRQVAPFGTGEWDDEGYHGGTEESLEKEWTERTEMIGRAYSKHSDELDARETIVVVGEESVVRGRQESLLRRRSITWSVQDFETVVARSEPPSRPPLGTHTSSNGATSSESLGTRHGSAESGRSSEPLLKGEIGELYYSQTTAPLRDHTNAPDRRKSVPAAAFSLGANLAFPSSSTRININTYAAPPIALSKRHSDPRRHSNPIESRPRASYSSADIYATTLTASPSTHSRYSTTSAYSSTSHEPPAKRNSARFLSVGGQRGSQTAPSSPSRGHFSSHTFVEESGVLSERRDDISEGVADALEELKPRFSWLVRSDSSGTLPKPLPSQRLVLANPDSPCSTARTSYDFGGGTSHTVSPPFTTVSQVSN